ncbi:unnamed protein product, partial [Candidula unifasciata]
MTDKTMCRLSVTGIRPELGTLSQTKRYRKSTRTFLCAGIFCVTAFSCSVSLVSCSVSADARYSKCKDVALETAAKMANVVVSGRVQKLINDQIHSTDDKRVFKGEVEIKRIFKGDNVVNTIARLTPGLLRQYKTITVEGFGEPSICDSRVRERETKIFCLSVNADGELQLNSSVVALSLHNLDYVDAVIH